MAPALSGGHNGTHCTKLEWRSIHFKNPFCEEPSDSSAHQLNQIQGRLLYLSIQRYHDFTKLAKVVRESCKKNPFTSYPLWFNCLGMCKAKIYSQTGSPAEESSATYLQPEI